MEVARREFETNRRLPAIKAEIDARPPRLAALGRIPKRRS